MITLDPTTKAEYDAATTAADRAQVVLNALTAPVYVRIYDETTTLRASGTMAAPWATRNAAVLTIGELAGFNVSSGGTPGPGWSLRFESGSRYVRGTFGLSGADFTWSLPSFTTGQMGNIGTGTLTATAPAAGGTIAAGAQFMHMDFTNLANGANILSMVNTWGTQGTGAYTGYGCFGDTAIKRPGKASSLRMTIKARTTGRPGDDAATPANSGDFGFLKALPAPVTEGGTIRWGAWVRRPAGFSWGSDTNFGTGHNGAGPTGQIKMLRLEKYNSSGVSAGGKIEHQVLTGLWIGQSGTTQYGWTPPVEGQDQAESETKKQSDATVLLQADTWHWLEFYAKVSANGALCERRAWLDNVLIYEIIGTQFKYRNSGGTYTTQTWGSAIPLIDSGGSIRNFYWFTYWNGGAPQDQSFYTSDIIVSNNNELASDLVTDAFGNKMIGKAYLPNGFTPEAGFSVSGALADGGTITITGSGFGTKDHQATTLFTDVEGYTVNESLPAPWTSYYAASPLTYPTTERAYRGTKSIKTDMDAGEHSGVYLEFTPGVTEVYFSARSWADVLTDTDPPDAGGPNLKTYHLSGAVGNHGAHPVLAMTQGVGNCLINDTRTCYDYAGGAGATNFTADNSGVFIPIQQWNRHEHYVNVGTYDNTDGYYYFKINQWGQWRNSGMPAGGHFASPNNIVPHTTYWGEPYKVLYAGIANQTLRSQFLPFYKRSSNRGNFWTDEIYIDTGVNAQARFEIGPDAGFGTDSRARNPCPYSAWSPGSVTLTLNAGVLGLAGRALYFISHNGTVTKIGRFD